MEPSPSRPPVVPKLHLLLGHVSLPSSLQSSRVEERPPHQSYRSHLTERSAVKNEPLQQHSYRNPTRPRAMTSTTADKVVVPARIFSASADYVESPKLPRMLQRQLKDPLSSSFASPHRGTRQLSSAGDAGDNDDNEDAFRILHPSLDLNDETGELSKLMLSKWSVDAGEDAFTSISLFCEVKLNEAKRMASWVESPNRFFATVCCQLLEKYINRIAAGGAGNANNTHDTGLGQSTELLRKLHAELVNAIFLPSSSGVRPSSSSSERDDYVNRIPYFTADANSKDTKSAACSNSSASSRVVRIKDLVHFPIDALLLYWFRMNLQMSSSIEKVSDRTIKNFTTDLTDGRRYSFLLHRLFPTWFDATMVHEIDSDQRLRNIESFHSRIQPVLPKVVTSDSIRAGSVTENVAFVAMLFGSSVGSIRKVNLERQCGEFLNIITSWKRVRSLLLEVKHMNDNYDTLMVAHLMKEMRTCETLFKQLNNELSSIAIASNETSSALSQIAYKILGLTWSCVHAKATNQVASLGTIDKRWQERIKDFTHIDIASVRELLIADSASQHHQQLLLKRMSRSGGSSMSTMMAPVVPERDVQLRIDALQSVLLVYSKDLHDIFKYYRWRFAVYEAVALCISVF
ncbi:hypothetical protein FI667_g3843, partial [Globisporangium splendens]